MKLRVLLAAGAAAFSLAVPAFAQTQAPAPQAWPQTASDLPADPEIRFGQLPNGMLYAIRRNATPPGEASLRLRIGAGSLHEAEDQRGLAHFLEHMVLNGTTNVPEGEFIARLERHGLRFGPDTNARTEFGQTVYMLELPETDDDTIDTSLFLLRETADEALLAPASIDSERPIIQSEERTRATPQLRILTDQLSYLMPGQLLPRRMPIGAGEVIATAPRERFVSFYNAYYRPERAALIAVGDFDVDAMERRIRERFGSWTGQGPAGPEPDRGAPASRQSEARLIVEPGGPASIQLSWVRPPERGPASRADLADQFAEVLALRILNRRLERLAAGSSAPPPFIAGVSSSQTLAASAKLTQLVAVVRPGEWRPALQALDLEQRRLVEQGVTAAELAREIEDVETTFAGAVSSAATRASSALAEELISSLEDYEVATSPAENEQSFQSVREALTADRIGRAARNLFDGAPLLYMTSPAAVEGAETALLAAFHEARAQALPAASDEIRQAATWPYTAFGPVGRVAERRRLPGETGATAIRFANGVRLTVKPTSFADEQVLVSVRYGLGRRAIPNDRASPEWALGVGFAGLGTNRIDFEDLQEALTGQTYGAGMNVTDDAFQLSGATTSEDFEIQMQVFAAYVSDPGWRASAWDRIRSLSGTLHDTFASTPSGVFTRDVSGLLYSGDRRWVMPSREEMARGTVEEARAILEPAMRGPVEIVVVGDITLEEAIAQVGATFGALPAQPLVTAPALTARFPAATAVPVRLTHGGRGDQALVYLGWPTTDFYADPRRARVLNLLSDIYRLRLTQRVREEQGATYSPEAGHAASDTIPGYGVFAAQIETRPEAVDAFLRDAEAIAADLTAAPVTADELQRALRPRVEGLQRQMNGNAWWLNNLARAQTDPRVAPALDASLAHYRSITPADLQAAARQYLRPGGAFKVVVLPAAGAAAP